MKILILLTLVCVATSAQEQGHPNRPLAISIVAMSATSVTDICSSWHRPEANGLLRGNTGTFGARGISIKLGTVASIALLEYRLRKHRQMRNAFVIGNYANAGASAFAAVHNWRLR